MKAPCGIEIMIGQVWRLSKSQAPLRVFDMPQEGDSVVLVETTDTHWKTTMPIVKMSNQRGGYRLIEPHDE